MGADNEPVGLVDGTDSKEQTCRSTLIGAEPPVIPAHARVEIQRVAHAHVYKSINKTVQRDRITGLDDGKSSVRRDSNVSLLTSSVEETDCAVYVFLSPVYRSPAIDVFAVIHQKHLLEQTAAIGFCPANHDLEAVHGRYDDAPPGATQQSGVCLTVVSVAKPPDADVIAGSISGTEAVRSLTGEGRLDSQADLGVIDVRYHRIYQLDGSP